LLKVTKHSSLFCRNKKDKNIRALGTLMANT
jgi:hypothetical protein